MGNTSDKNGRKARVTIKDVASAANVSIATVSYVLNNKPGQSISEDTRKKVLQFANLLGYECNVMARYLATGMTNTVAVVVKDLNGLNAAYYIKLITELTGMFSFHNRALIVTDYKSSIERTGAACDAYITLALSEQDFRAFADTKYVPVVAIDTVFEDFLFYRINDDFKAMYNAARAALSADKITLLTHPLSRECLQRANKAFDGVTVISSLRDLPQASDGTSYAAYSAAIAECLDFPVYIAQDDSITRKAAATVDAVNKAINRIGSSAEEHDIEI